MADPLDSDDYMRLGFHFARAVGTAVALGHNSPATLGDYVVPGDDPLQQVVLDAFESALIGPDGDAARARTAAWVNAGALLDDMANAIAGSPR